MTECNFHHFSKSLSIFYPVSFLQLLQCIKFNFVCQGLIKIFFLNLLLLQLLQCIKFNFVCQHTSVWWSGPDLNGSQCCARAIFSQLNYRPILLQLLQCIKFNFVCQDILNGGAREF
jgi:hypothetical protein